MESVFLHLLNMSITAGWLVLAVVALRLIFRRAPKWVHCLLWVLVAVRLLCPVSLESALSLIPSAQTVPVEDFLYHTPAIHSGVPVVDAVVNPVISNSFAPTPGYSVNPMQVVSMVAANLWVLGIVGMVLYAVISTFRLRRRVREAAYVRDNVWQCDAIATPFILGIIRPRIYLPTLLGAEEAKSVVAHEQAHLARRDHWWKPLGFLLLTVYWFNPLLWLGYILLCRDIEAACDERVVRDMDAEGRKEYSRILLSCSAPRRLVTACPLAFGETGVKSRIKAVLNYKKPAFWLVVVAVVATVAAAVCLLTNPKTTVSDDLDAALSRIILDYNRGEHTGDAYPTEAHTVLGVEKKRGNTVVYTMVLYEEYYLDELGDLQVQSGSHIPTVLTIRKKNGSYTLVDYRIPRDGSEFAKDIKALFPARLRGKVDTALYSEKHRAATLAAARQYFSPWQTALHQAILTNNRKESGDGIFAAESHRIYGVAEGEYRLTVYALVYYHEYAWENGAVAERSGSLVPTAVTFLKNGDAYDVTEYWTPGDNWEESIRGKFPENLWDKALTYANYPVEELKAECLAQANAYFGLKDAFAAPLTFSSMNWLSDAKLDALYADLPTNSLKQYLPVISMATRADLDAFIAEYKKDFSLDRAKGDGLTPIHQLSFYDDAFFAEKVLLAVYYKDGSCSAQPSISGITYTGGNSILQVQVNVYEPQAGDTALGQWFMLCEVDRSALEGVTAYSAVVHSRTTDTDTNTFTGRVTQVEKGMMLMDCYDTDKFTSVWVLLPSHGDLHPAVGQEYVVTHDGRVMETYPPQVTAVSVIHVSSTPTTTTIQPTTTTTVVATTTTTTKKLTTTTTQPHTPTPKDPMELSAQQETIIKSSWVSKYTDPEPQHTVDAVTITYYGTYNGYIALTIEDNYWGYPGVVWDEEVGGVVFKNLTCFGVQLWKDGKIDSLGGAYLNSKIDELDLKDIAYYWHNRGLTANPAVSLKMQEASSGASLANGRMLAIKRNDTMLGHSLPLRFSKDGLWVTSVSSEEELDVFKKMMLDGYGQDIINYDDDWRKFYIEHYSTSLEEKYRQYDAAYFKENSLVMVFFPYISSSLRGSVTNLVRQGDEICIEWIYHFPESGAASDDVNPRYILVEAKNADLVGVEKWSHHKTIKYY